MREREVNEEGSRGRERGGGERRREHGKGGGGWGCWGRGKESRGINEGECKDEGGR